MTTNQTIDGVPRAWLEDYESLADLTSGDAQKLRALLDAPEHVHEWDINQEGTATVCHCGARSSDKPAAQPQGEPVAPFYICAVDFNRLVRDDTAIASVRMSRDRRGPFTEPLYAEQPTPVAVVGSGGHLRAEARQCDKCNHVGINDSAVGIGACHDCEWQGAEPIEDKCPGCDSENCMAAACPKCGARYVLLAEENLPIQACLDELKRLNPSL